MTERPPINVRVTAAANGVVLVAPDGEIGYHEAPAFRNAIKEAYDKKPRRLIADLSAVSYMGTPGLATLVEALQIAKRSDTVLVLCGLTDRVRGVFEIARLHTVFKIVPDSESALTA